MTFEDTPTLTPNAVSILTRPSYGHGTNYRPTCQVVGIEKVTITAGPIRFKVILSDGIHSVQAVLAFKSNWIGTKLCSNDIVEITDYNSVRSNRNIIIIVQDLFVKQPDVNKVFGEPIPFLLGSESFLSTKVSFSDQPPPSPTAPYVNEEHIIIDDWVILTNGSVQGVVRNHPSYSDGSEIATSTAACFCCPDTLTIDFDSDLDSINDQGLLVTITGSCYELGLKNDTHKRDFCIVRHMNNQKKGSISRTIEVAPGNISVGKYAAHVFTGTYVGEVSKNSRDGMIVKLDMINELGCVEVGIMVVLGYSAYTQSRNMYRLLNPLTVPIVHRPSVLGDRVAILLIGQLTEKRNDCYCMTFFRSSTDDCPPVPLLDAQFPPDEVHIMVDLFRQLNSIKTVRTGSCDSTTLPETKPMSDHPLKRRLFESYPDDDKSNKKIKKDYD